MEEGRQNPDQLLKAIQAQQNTNRPGKLKIFFGYSAGVGKTYTMLKAAHQLKNKHVDVVVGYIEPHPRPETAALMEGLEVLPYAYVKDNQIWVNELDTEGVLNRKPEVVLVDELAHTNATSCHNRKRYQDVEEFLRAGIDVYTTVNVQHLESLNDIVASITGIAVRERIPDKIFDEATQVELVDIEPADLLVRMNEGKIYSKTKIKHAQANFFTLDHLTALREIAMRRCADRVNRIGEMSRIQNNSSYFTDEHILVCLSSSATNAKLIRTAARMAQAFHGNFTALYVETGNDTLTVEEEKCLQDNIKLATSLGAKVETTVGEDIAYQIAEFSRLNGISKIVVGRFAGKNYFGLQKSTINDKLISYVNHADVYIIPTDTNFITNKHRSFTLYSFALKDIYKLLLALVLCTLIGFGFSFFGLKDINIIPIYILGALVYGMYASGSVYGILYAIGSVMSFNFFFIEPRYTFASYDPSYIVTFLILFITSMITGNLANRVKQHGLNALIQEGKIKVLFDTNQQLQKANTEVQIAEMTSKQLARLLNTDVLFYRVEKDNLVYPYIHISSTQIDQQKVVDYYCTDNESAVATWVFKNNKKAGVGTDTLSSAKCEYLAVRIGDSVYGVVGIGMKDRKPLTIAEGDMMLSVLGECALAIQGLRNLKEKEIANIQAERDKLRANMLRAISHDLRTPLTVISGHANLLSEKSSVLSEDKKEQLYQEIKQESNWLISLVENLLSITKLEDASMQLNFQPQLLDEVVQEALKHVSIRATEEQKIQLKNKCGNRLLLVKMDARLVLQAIMNVLDNALKYAPKNLPIQVVVGIEHKRHHNKNIGHTNSQSDYVYVEVRDLGPGVPNDVKSRIFELFYTGNPTIIDSTRSLGLGLTLCKSIMKLHGGDITVKDNKPNGSIFRLSFPLEKVDIHE